MNHRLQPQISQIKKNLRNLCNLWLNLYEPQITQIQQQSV